MKLSKEDGRNIISGSHPDWELLESLGASADSPELERAVYQHAPTGKTYLFKWTLSANGVPFEDCEPEPQEVRAAPKFPFPGDDSAED